MDETIVNKKRASEGTTRLWLLRSECTAVILSWQIWNIARKTFSVFLVARVSILPLGHLKAPPTFLELLQVFIPLKRTHLAAFRFHTEKKYVLQHGKGRFTWASKAQKPCVLQEHGLASFPRQGSKPSQIEAGKYEAIEV